MILKCYLEDFDEWFCKIFDFKAESDFSIFPNSA